MSRQRLSCSGSIGISQVPKIEFVQSLERLFFFLGQRLLDQFAGGIGRMAPALPQIRGNVPLLAGTERTERPPQENQRAAELVFIERRDVAGQLFPERLPREKRVSVALGQPLEPAGAQVGWNARRKP